MFILNYVDEKLQNFDKRSKVMLMGDVSIDLNSDFSSKSECTVMHMIGSNAFSCLITKPTRVATNSQTIIDHVPTNDTESVITPGVSCLSLPTTYAIYYLIPNHDFKVTKNITIRLLFAIFILWMALNFVTTLHVLLRL